MTVRTVTSHVLNLHGAARVGDSVRFRLLDGMYTSIEHVPADVQTATIDASGNISIVLYCPANYDCIIANAMRFQFTLPDSAVATTLEALHASGEASPTATNALQTLIDAHAAQADPHAIYLTQVEGDARYSLLAHTHAFASLTSLPTTLAGYGITDAYTKAAADARYAPIAVSFASLTGKPTTLAGYGVTAVVATAVTHELGPVSSGLGVGTTLYFPMPAGETTRYGIRANLGNFGAYNDMLLQIGLNLDHEVAGKPTNTLNFESQWDDGNGFQTETIFTWTSPDGSITRRPYTYSIKYATGIVSQAFEGQISFATSPGIEHVRIEENGDVYIKADAKLVFERPDATASGNLLLFKKVSGTVLGNVDYSGSMGLGAGAGADARLYLFGTGDLARIAYFATTPNKSWYVGVEATGDFVFQGTDSSHVLRMAQTTGRVAVGNPTWDPFPFAARLGVSLHASEVGVAVVGVASQTFDFQQWLDVNSVIQSRVNKAGYYMTRKVAAPADGDLVTSELAVWFDNTNGSGKAMFKGKTANGTIVTGSVALS